MNEQERNRVLLVTQEKNAKTLRDQANANKIIEDEFRASIKTWEAKTEVWKGKKVVSDEQRNRYVLEAQASAAATAKAHAEITISDRRAAAANGRKTVAQAAIVKATAKAASAETRIIKVE